MVFKRTFGRWFFLVRVILGSNSIAFIVVIVNNRNNILVDLYVSFNVKWILVNTFHIINGDFHLGGLSILVFLSLDITHLTNIFLLYWSSLTVDEIFFAFQSFVSSTTERNSTRKIWGFDRINNSFSRVKTYEASERLMQHSKLLWFKLIIEHVHE